MKKVCLFVMFSLLLAACGKKSEIPKCIEKKLETDIVIVFVNNIGIPVEVDNWKCTKFRE